ncbi:unnamed protein product [Sphagnum jensenii]|uniref:Uncharacterized protein n=1 Tax=Sphagnum jensenii TaxID=128206 RepID=A0ABP1BE76_9BRYO
MKEAAAQFESTLLRPGITAGTLEEHLGGLATAAEQPVGRPQEPVENFLGYLCGGLLTLSSSKFSLNREEAGGRGWRQWAPQERS